MYDVIGISNALVDISAKVNEEFILENKLNKGDFHLVDNEKFKLIHDKLNNTEINFGGSVANTISALNLLGCKVSEIVKIGKDKYGEMLVQENQKKGVNYVVNYDELPTGTVICLITPDGERTFIVYLGACQNLSSNDISEDLIKQTKYLHIAGYEFENVQEAVLKAVKIAKQNNVKVSFDLGSPAIIERNHKAILEFIKEYVDIIFANDDEAKQLTRKENQETLDELYKLTETAIVKLGEHGSLIKYKDKTYIIPAYKVKAIDTTGAGDMYGAGILFGLIKNLPIEEAGKIASYFASKVVEKIGARLDKIDLNEINVK